MRWSVRCDACGQVADRRDVAWVVIRLSVGSEQDELHVCSACQQLLAISERGLVKKAAHWLGRAMPRWIAARQGTGESPPTAAPVTEGAGA